jgi:hypothetical protein
MLSSALPPSPAIRPRASTVALPKSATDRPLDRDAVGVEFQACGQRLRASARPCGPGRCRWRSASPAAQAESGQRRPAEAQHGVEIEFRRLQRRRAAPAARRRTMNIRRAPTVPRPNSVSSRSTAIRSAPSVMTPLACHGLHGRRPGCVRRASQRVRGSPDSTLASPAKPSPAPTGIEPAAQLDLGEPGRAEFQPVEPASPCRPSALRRQGPAAARRRASRDRPAPRA